eukprot:m.535973 g.535973  ORF g.535973 m.535973 type:complete len:184 (+) comp22067_c0_seq10:13-564(+)
MHCPIPHALKTAQLSQCQPTGVVLQPSRKKSCKIGKNLFLNKSSGDMLIASASQGYAVPEDAAVHCLCFKWSFPHDTTATNGNHVLPVSWNNSACSQTTAKWLWTQSYCVTPVDCVAGSRGQADHTLSPSRHSVMHAASAPTGTPVLKCSIQKSHLLQNPCPVRGCVCMLMTKTFPWQPIAVQ